MAWAGTTDDLADWLAVDDAAIAAREQDRRRATIAEVGAEVG